MDKIENYPPEIENHLPEKIIRKNTFSTLLVMICTFGSRIFGFLKTLVITAVFGAGGTADVINLTFAVPNNLRKLLAEGALSSAFIPVLSDAIVKDKGKAEHAKTIVRSIFGFQLLIIIPLCGFCIVFADPLIRFVLTQFKDPFQISLATGLFRFFINYLLFISISAVLMGVLNSHSRFFIPAVTPILFSVSVIGSILLLHRILGPYSMAVGVIIGGAAQILFQYPQFRKLGYDLKLSFDFKSPEFRKILKQWLPVLATSSVYTVNQQIAFLLASGLQSGSTSALTNALVFWQLPFGIFSASITTVLFPQMSRQVSSGDTVGLRNSLQYGLRFLFVLLVPSALVMSILGKEIISTAIQRGLFTAENTMMTAMVLSGYSIGLFSVGAFNFLQRFFYSSKDFKIPLRIAVVVCGIDIVLSLILKETWLGVTGLAIAHSTAFTIGLFAMLYYARKRLKRIEGKKILLTMGKVLVSLFPVAAVLWVFKLLLGPWWISGSSFTNLFFLILETALAGVILLGMYRLLNIEMFSSILGRNISKKQIQYEEVDE